MTTESSGQNDPDLDEAVRHALAGVLAIAPERVMVQVQLFEARPPRVDVLVDGEASPRAEQHALQMLAICLAAAAHLAPAAERASQEDNRGTSAESETKSTERAGFVVTQERVDTIAARYGVPVAGLPPVLQGAGEPARPAIAVDELLALRSACIDRSHLAPALRVLEQTAGELLAAERGIEAARVSVSLVPESCAGHDVLLIGVLVDGAADAEAAGHLAALLKICRPALVASR